MSEEISVAEYAERLEEGQARQEAERQNEIQTAYHHIFTGSAEQRKRLYRAARNSKDLRSYF